ncbi:MAG: hypothetical protein K6B41_10245 [Butyrivibrio sp.]|nr:hypothetical protein [Butyrivibrio sp.]
MLKKKVLNGLGDFNQKVVLKYGPAAAFVNVMAGAVLSMGYADAITDMLKTSVNGVFTILVFGGIINIAMGIRSIAKAVQDDGSNGQDAAVLAKGRGQLVAGIIMVLPVPAIKLFTGKDAGSLLTQTFIS